MRNAGRRYVTCRAAGTAAHPAGCARLPAFHRGSRQRDSSSQRLSTGPGFVGWGATRDLPAVTRPLPAMHLARRSTCGGFEVPKIKRLARIGTSNPKPHLDHNIARVRLIPKFASETPPVLANFGIGHACAGRHDARAARERSAIPPAGTVPAPMARYASGPCPSHERGGGCNCVSDECQVLSLIKRHVGQHAGWGSFRAGGDRLLGFSS
jgi:hypothetical protein